MASNFKEHIPNMIDRQLLVWYKKYPNKAAIPASVNENMMKKVTNKARVHGALLMMAATAIGFFFTAIAGKRAIERGESVNQINIDFHKNYDHKK
ncbi:unnamed protein product [Medioppia subpectinata]|uniref:Uncharacterized protein n=1 Tax=Medioppia subpectinata TaxID=1979941 RepID=A0A7R9PV87_9ACAR|nr:unnamed protein product [Medioppia subpectinata]CAG2102408.1 unnamed protein product [Medioppia subpectinata]